MIAYCDDILSMSDDEYNYLFSLMPKSRQLRTNKYLMKKDRISSVSAYGLLARMLENTGLDIKDFEIKYKDNGKPYFSNSEIKFNISHTYDAVACGISRSEIGVDIQTTIDKSDELIRHVCAEDEASAIFASDDKNLAFTKIWTLKESYVKCIGSGISDDMKKYNFTEFVSKNHGTKYDFEFVTMQCSEYCVSACGTEIGTIYKTNIHDLTKNKN